jgi:hypothetical protein
VSSNLTLSARNRCSSSTLGQFGILTHPRPHPSAVRPRDTIRDSEQLFSVLVSSPRPAALVHNDVVTTVLTGTLSRPMSVVKTKPDIVLDGRLSSHGPFEHVYAKLVPVNRRCIEAVCAWIGHEVGLPLPEIRFVRVLKNRLPLGCAWPYKLNEEEWAFGSLAIEGARPLVGFDSVLAVAKVDKWSHLELAAAFDQLVANDDRTEGNILLDPKGSLWLIDHARSLGGGGQRLFSTEVLPLVNNFFLARVASYPLAERMKRRGALLSACTRLVSAAMIVPYKSLMVPADMAIQIQDFLLRRASLLQAMVFDAAGIPDMYDNQLQEGVQ